MPMYEYRCPNGHVSELITVYERRSLSQKCICGADAEYIISAPKLDYYHMGIDPTMGTAADKWADMHEQKARQEKKQNE